MVILIIFIILILHIYFHNIRQPVIKKNRESDRLDFADQEARDVKRVHTIDSKIPKNSFADKI